MLFAEFQRNFNCGKARTESLRRTAPEELTLKLLMLPFLIIASIFGELAAQTKHDHRTTDPDSGSANSVDIAKNKATNQKLLNRETLLADARVRRLQVEAQFADEGIDAEELAAQLASIRQELMEIDAREDAVSVSMRVGDLSEVSPRTRALAWFDLAKIVSKSPVDEAASSFASAAEAYDLAVQCMAEIPAEKREKRDFEIEGSARSWLALSCDTAGNKQRAMDERLKILMDKELCANTYPEVVIGVYQTFVNYYERLGNDDDAEAMRAAAARFLVERSKDISAEQKLTIGLALIANARTAPRAFRLKLLEELWNEPSLKNNLLILRVGNDLGLYYFFDPESEKRRASFYTEMLARCEQILQPKSFRGGDKDSTFKDLKGLESQALVLALESVADAKVKKQWKQRLKAVYVQFGRSLTFPENHPYANDENLRTLATLVTKYHEELIPKPSDRVK